VARKGRTVARDLFTDVAAPTVRVRSSSRYTILISIAVHALIVAAVVIVPLLATGALPAPATELLAFVPATPVPSPPPVPAPPAQPAEKVAEPIHHDAAPIVQPDGIRDEIH
jgi:hypothetical protein